MQILVNMISLSAFYVSFALGLALIFGVMRTINLAHGEFYMLGGYVLWLMVVALKGTVPDPAIFVVALVAGCSTVGLLGLLLQLSLFRVLRDQPFAILMATLGLSYIIQVLVTQFIGPIGRSVPTLFRGFIRTETMIIPYQRLAVAGLVFVAVTVLWIFLTRTKPGRSVRAVAQNPRGAILQGISLARVSAMTMLIGTGLAAFSGILIGSINSVHPFMGADAIWRAFIIIIVGGVGSIPGAAIAAVLFAVLDTSLNATGMGHFAPMIDALLMLSVLSFLPHGLLGTRE